MEQKTKGRRCKIRYLGGKARISGKLTSFLESQRKPGQLFIDGMVGGGSIIRNMSGFRIANDHCPYLFSFYTALQNNWLPPEHISEERYKDLLLLYKNGVCNGEIGFAMYFCSFGGKGWGGYARDPKTNRDFSHEAYNDSLRLKEQIKDVKFYSFDYYDLLSFFEKKDALVYFDIPYEGTTEYKTKFNHEKYWNNIREFSSKYNIFTSSYTAPEDFECVWEIERKTELNTKGNKKEIRIEKLFKFKSNT